MRHLRRYWEQGMTGICCNKTMARISLRPEFRFSREPGACQEASKGMNSRPPEAAEKGLSRFLEVRSGMDGCSPPAVSSPARRMGVIERCLRRGTKKGAIPQHAGLRGGSWNNNATNERVSDRNNASWANTNRNNNIGARAARTPQGRAMEVL